MPDIMVVLACVSQCVELTTLRQLGRVIEAMLSISGRVTMKGLSRWSGPRGSYRTIQRLFTTSVHWCQLNWLLIRHHLLDVNDVILMSGDHVVVTKSGKTTYGLDRFFSSLYGKAVPGLCFLSLSLLSVQRRTSYPVVTEQVEKPCEASGQTPPKKQTSGSRGRPKGSKNRHRREVALSPSLGFIQAHIQRLLEQIGEAFNSTVATYVPRLSNMLMRVRRSLSERCNVGWSTSWGAWCISACLTSFPPTHGLWRV